MQTKRQKAGLHLHSPAGCRPRTGHSFAWCVPPLKTGRLQSETRQINKLMKSIDDEAPHLI